MEITVFLPETEYSKLYIKTLSGDIEISDAYRFSEAEIYNTSGDVSFSAEVESNLFVKTVSGDMSFRSSDAKTLRLTSTSGDIHGTLLTAKTFAIETVSGEVRVPSSVTGGRCEIVTTSGDVVFTIQGG